MLNQRFDIITSIICTIRRQISHGEDVTSLNLSDQQNIRLLDRNVRLTLMVDYFHLTVRTLFRKQYRNASLRKIALSRRPDHLAPRMRWISRRYLA